MSRRYPEWDRDGVDWPNRAASQFVSAGGYNWHVQIMGPEQGDPPTCLLVHGTGAATHSWRDLLPLLAKQYRVIAIDLPGHGFTRPNPAQRVTLPGMAQSIARLLDTLEAFPQLIVSHSAGAAIGLQLMLDQCWKIPLVGFAPALKPFPGLAAKVFPQLAKMLFSNPFVSVIFARIARGPGQVSKFLKRSTGSRIDAAGVDYYRRLFSRSGHCDGAIRMMAGWQLEQLQHQMTMIRSPVMLVHATNDSAIPKSAIVEAADKIPDCALREMKNLGHLAHEEDAEQAAAIITEFAQQHLT